MTMRTNPRPIIYQPRTRCHAFAMLIATAVIAACCSHAAAEDGLVGTYYAGIDFTGASATRIDAALDLSWPSGTSPVPGVVETENWSAIWVGAIDIPSGGSWTFTTLSDDGIRLAIDGSSVIDNWTGHAPTEDSGSVALTTGSHRIEVRYFNSHFGGVVQLSWAGPAVARQIVPSSALRPVVPPAIIGTGTGLTGSYQRGGDFSGPTVSRVDQTVDFAWADEPAPGIPPGVFCATWSGWIEPQYTDTYRFTIASSGAVDLRIDALRVIDHLGSVSSSALEGTAYLIAGRRYEIGLRMRHVGPGPSVHLSWASALTPTRIVPVTQLYPSVPAESVALTLSTPLDSRTSPAWIEGGIGRSSAEIAARMNGDAVAVVPESSRRWHLASPGTADGPAIGLVLRPGANQLALTASDAGVTQATTRTVTWQTTDLSELPYGLDRFPVRSGDHLLLTAHGAGAVLEIDVDADASELHATVTGTPGSPLDIPFTRPGSHTVIARIDGVEAGRMVVVVASADLRAPIACHLRYQRSKDVALAGSDGVVFVANDPGALEVGDSGATADGRRLRLRPLNAGGAAIEARLGTAAGPMLGACPIDVFTLGTSAAASIHVVETYPDGSQLLEGVLTMRPLVPGLDIRLSMYTGGSTFDDGTLSQSKPSSAFTVDADGVGRAAYRLILGPNPGTWACHNIRGFQNDVQVSNF